MRSRRQALIAGATAAVAAAALLPLTATAGQAEDPTSPAALYRTLQNNYDRVFLQTLGRPDGEDMVYRISGIVALTVPGDQYATTPTRGDEFEHGRVLFGFEGFNIRQLYVDPADPTRVHLLSREIVFYTDVRDRTRIITEWTNPLTGETHPIFPVNNDKVNSVFTVRDGRLGVTAGPSFIPFGNTFTPILDELVTTSDIPPLYSLQERYGINDPIGLHDDASGNPRYASWEMFDFYVDETEYRARDGRLAPKGAMEVKNSWTRIAPWVPWMCISENDVDGNLMYHARSYTLDSYDDMEDWLKAAVEESYPVYTASPEAPTPGPNQTTWTSFWTNQLDGGALTWADWCAATAT